ncbi:uncharacterized protein EI97DRAFT_461039 [Westerdykella ornata]|uniref:Uncharacterized protein n=1 Tax=Westerdykella ornata TaxID=318751 RepID=A0A6A6JBR3_WESOR|nr:uncharacterized protein EI97DRAFT_461039 [Westerdykella ornata]KAF2273613.1 hypothetical protein EI97DRAFT_461039 [Westerdykella ornata]
MSVGNSTQQVSYGDLSAILQETERYAKVIYASSSEQLLNQLLFDYWDGQESCEMRTKPPQKILDGIVFTEVLILRAWNEHRLGQAGGYVYPLHNRCFRAPNFPYDLPKPDPDMQAYIDRVILDEHGNVRDVDDAFPARRTAKLMNAYYAIPGPLEPNSLRVRPELPRNDVAAAKQPDPSPVAVEQPQSRPEPSGDAKARGSQGTKSRPTAHDDHNRLADAPGTNLDFPNGNITAVEILAFFPHWLKSWDVIDRLVSNGWTTSVMTRVINCLREMPNGPVASNTVLRMMAPSMRHRPEGQYAKWTVGSHQMPANWDPSSISVTGFRTPRLTHPRTGNGADTLNAPVPPIPFKDLARGVEFWPAGYDALDLTQCIQYHVAHPEEEWRFPTDFGALLDRIGRITVLPEHSDSVAFQRWCANKNPTDLSRVSEAAQSNENAPRGNKQRREEVDSSSPGSGQVERPSKRLRIDSAGESTNNAQQGGVNGINDAQFNPNPAQPPPACFNSLGFQYLHTIHLPPPHEVDDMAENIRWSHQNYEQGFTLSPQDIATVTALRIRSGWCSVHCLNAMGRSA